MKFNVKIESYIKGKQYAINRKNLLIRNDFLIAAKELPDNSIDMIFCDPPYGKSSASWDVEIDLNKMWAILNRVIKPSGAIIVTGQQPFSSKLVCSNIKNYKHNWYWVKNVSGAHMLCDRMPLPRVEDIFVFGKSPNSKIDYYPIMEKREKPITYTIGSTSRIIFGDNRSLNRNNGNIGKKTSFWKYPKNVLFFKAVSNKSKIKVEGITQKPVELIEYLIKTYTKKGAAILDPTAGSGTTGVAALNTNRRFCLIEKNVENFNKMLDRFNRGEG